MNIRDNLININGFSRPGIQLNSHSYIVIHYTGSNGGRADAIRNYFNNMNGNYASSQYIVDTDGSIVRAIPENEVAWHAGNYNMNLNSIGIEVCCFDRLNSGSAQNGDWYFTDETYKALIELVKDLMTRYNIPEDHVIRHYDVTGKYCPAMWVKNESAWNEFKNKLTNVVPVEPIVPQNKHNIGEVVTFSSCYKSSTSGINEAIILKTWGKGTITRINNGTRNPYLIDNGRCWINDGDIRDSAQPVVNQSNKYKTNATINVRAGAGLNYAVVKLYKQGQVFDVYEQSNGWGRTPSGWVKLSFCTKV